MYYQTILNRDIYTAVHKCKVKFDTTCVHVLMFKVICEGQIVNNGDVDYYSMWLMFELYGS